MSKIRIYELARELGVDNRVVISKAIEFGAPPRTSHSNSLESSEADAIRRALIREAMGGSAKLPSTFASTTPKETVTVRTVRPIGSQEQVVERRQGNVIMRRKQGSVVAAQADSSASAVVEADSPSPSFVASITEVDTDGVLPRAVEQSSESQAATMAGLSEAVEVAVSGPLESASVESANVKSVPESATKAYKSSSSEAVLSSNESGYSAEVVSPSVQVKVIESSHLADGISSGDGSGKGELSPLISQGLVDQSNVDKKLQEGATSEAVEVASESSTTKFGEDDRVEHTQLKITEAVSGDTTPSSPVTEDGRDNFGPKSSGVIENRSVAQANVAELTELPSMQGVTQKSAVGSVTTSLGASSAAQPAITIISPNTQFVVSQSIDEDRRQGPRVLGRIELPQRKVVRIDKDGAEAAPKRLGVVAGVSYVEEEEEVDSVKKGGKRKVPSRKREFGRDDLVDYEGREVRRTSGKSSGKEKKDNRREAQELQKPIKVGKKSVKLGDSISVGDLARQMSLKAGEVISKLIELGILATINQVIDKDTAMILIDEFGYEVESTSFDEDQFTIEEGADSEENLVSRPPIVTVMGHVDHGKTSLLDAIRQTTVAAREAGGITQHIGAYSVNVDAERTITFIDTPGHAAFTAMRARGADCTDIVILVVAADDGVMPQTIEAINHAKAANVPIIVAVNKMDKHGANPDRVKQQLVERGLQPEDWGGDTMFFPVSALSRQGLPELLEGVLLLAEMKELRANPDRRAKGTVIEARQDRGRGIVATVLVQKGTLRTGDIYVLGQCSGRVRTMSNYRGEKIEAATPSTPVEITGLDGMPVAGDDFIVVESESIAREIASNRAEKLALAERALASGPISLEEFARRANNAAPVELNLVIKADVIGSLEAVRASVEQLSTPKVKVRVLHSGVGGVTENDVQLAIASKAVIVGFGVRGEPRAIADAESHRIEVRFYRVIYELLDDVKRSMAGLLAPIKKENFLGRVDVRETFNAPKVGTIAGCFVSDGIVKRGAFVRVLRDSAVVYEGKVGSLRRFKEDVRQVQAGYECGLSVDSFNDIKVGDSIDIYEVEEVAASLD